MQVLLFIFCCHECPAPNFEPRFPQDIVASLRKSIVDTPTLRIIPGGVHGMLVVLEDGELAVSVVPGAVEMETS